MSASALAQAPATQSVPAPAATPAPAQPPATYKLEGFRSATFGMTEAQLRQAIRKDFPAVADKITSNENTVERTTTLAVTVPDLLQGAGPGQVSYVLGFSTKKLIQVSVSWGGTTNPDFKAETAVVMANQLLSYLLGAGYRLDAVNAQGPNNTAIVFRGYDTAERMTILTLTVGSAGNQPAGSAPALLQLSYVLDPRNPDIYRIPRGQF